MNWAIFELATGSFGSLEREAVRPDHSDREQALGLELRIAKATR